MKKLNWGHGILIAIIVMVIAILTLVLKISNEKIELVTEDYYPKELKYEEEIQKRISTEKLSEQVTINIGDSIIIDFPKDFTDPSMIKGEVWFYKASNKKDDLKDSIRLNSNLSLKYPLKQFSNGKYDVIIDWKYDGTNYYHKESILID